MMSFSPFCFLMTITLLGATLSPAAFMDGHNGSGAYDIHTGHRSPRKRR